MSSIHYYLPLTERSDGILRSALGKGETTADLPVVGDLADYISSNYEEVERTVELSGQLYTVPVYLPKEQDDNAYLIVTGERVPVFGSTNSDPPPPAILDENLARDIEYSEALSPQESIFIPTSFIEPEFDEIESDGIASRRVTWPEMSDASRVVVVGQPGAGKSTVLRMLVLQLIERRRRGLADVVPIYIQLRHIEKGGATHDLLRHSVFGTSSQEHHKTSSPLSTARVTLFLDGLDEAPEHLRDGFAKGIAAFAARCRTLSIVASTREAGYNWWLKGFRHLRIRPFALSQIREWSYLRLNADPPVPWAGFISSLTERRELLEMAGNPLLLSLAVGLYRRNSTLPQNRAALLSTYFDAVVNQWDSARGVVRQPHAWAAPARKVAALCRTAFGLRESQSDSFSTRNFLEWNSAFGADRMLLDACQRDTGLLASNPGSDRWHFVHRTIADYLTARYIVHHTDDAHSSLMTIFESDDWLDVWSYSCGLAQDATGLLTSILKQKSISRTKKVYAIASAFEQDLIVSVDTIAACKKFIVREIQNSVVGASQVKLKRAFKGRHQRVSTLYLTVETGTDRDQQAPSKFATILTALKMLRRSSLGEQIFSWLGKSQDRKLQKMAAFLFSDGTASTVDSKLSTQLRDAYSVVLSIVDERTSIVEAPSSPPPKSETDI